MTGISRQTLAQLFNLSNGVTELVKTDVQVPLLLLLELLAFLVVESDVVVNA